LLAAGGDDFALAGPAKAPPSFPAMRDRARNSDGRRNGKWRKGWNLFRRTALLTGLVCLAGCSGFHREWRAAARQPAPLADLTGRWEGRWLSEVNGHEGRLRCLISRQSDGACQAYFHAQYAQILSFGYRVKLQVATNQAGTYQLAGEADLGRLAGGLYRYEGNATATNFFSTYRSEKDHGTFHMVRPR